MLTIFQGLVCSEADLQLLARVRAELQQHPAYVLWLQGEMGAGKTSFVRAFLYQLGLATATPVVSPTYTIMNEYQIGYDWYAHLDLYRAEDRFSLDEVGVRDLRRYKGIFIEWPEQVSAAESLPATHILSIEATDLESRSYRFIRVI